MAQANRLADSIYLGIMDNSEKLMNATGLDDIKILMSDHPGSTLIYNQNSDTRQIKNQIEFLDGQKTIEIFQDTEGVFGLRAYHQQGKIQIPITLELND